MQVVNERNAIYVTAVQRDDTGALVVPTTLDYRLDCLTNQQTILDWTAIASPGSEQQVVVTGAQNAIINDSQPYEDKQVTFRWDNGLATQGLSTQVWRVKNNYGAT